MMCLLDLPHTVWNTQRHVWVFPRSYYGLLAQRFSMLHQKWQALFEECFQKQYALIHRLETNKLRNVAKLFAHLLHTDAISWAVLSDIRLTEDDTTSSSRIFIKILFQVQRITLKRYFHIQAG